MQQDLFGSWMSRLTPIGLAFTATLRSSYCPWCHVSFTQKLTGPIQQDQEFIYQRKIRNQKRNWLVSFWFKFSFKSNRNITFDYFEPLKKKHKTTCLTKLKNKLKLQAAIAGKVYVAAACQWPADTNWWPQRKSLINTKDTRRNTYHLLLQKDTSMVTSSDE